MVVQRRWIRLGESGDPLVLPQHAAVLPFEFEASLKAVRIASKFFVDPSERFRIERHQTSVLKPEHLIHLVRLQHRDIPFASPAPDHFHSLPPTGNLPTALKGSPWRCRRRQYLSLGTVSQAASLAGPLWRV